MADRRTNAASRVVLPDTGTLRAGVATPRQLNAVRQIIERNLASIPDLAGVTEAERARVRAMPPDIALRASQNLAIAGARSGAPTARGFQPYVRGPGVVIGRGAEGATFEIGAPIGGGALPSAPAAAGIPISTFDRTRFVNERAGIAARQSKLQDNLRALAGRTDRYGKMESKRLDNEIKLLTQQARQSLAQEHSAAMEHSHNLTLDTKQNRNIVTQQDYQGLLRDLESIQAKRGTPEYEPAYARTVLAHGDALSTKAGQTAAQLYSSVHDDSAARAARVAAQYPGLVAVPRGIGERGGVGFKFISQEELGSKDVPQGVRTRVSALQGDLAFHQAQSETERAANIAANKPGVPYTRAAQLAATQTELAQLQKAYPALQPAPAAAPPVVAPTAPAPTAAAPPVEALQPAPEGATAAETVSRGIARGAIGLSPEQAASRAARGEVSGPVEQPAAAAAPPPPPATIPPPGSAEAAAAIGGVPVTTQPAVAQPNPNQAAIDWVRANPEDPRAARIKERLGIQ